MSALRRISSLCKPGLIRYQVPIAAARCFSDVPATSFARGIFLGELRESELFPYPDTLSDDQKETVSMMLSAGVAYMENSNDAVANDNNESIPEAQIEEMKALGMYGLMVPEEYGGLALNNTMYARFGELTGSYDLGMGIHTTAHQSLGYKGILLYGSEEQKQKYLPDLAVGNKFACFCLSEPSGGSEALTVQTEAIAKKDPHYKHNVAQTHDLFLHLVKKKKNVGGEGGEVNIENVLNEAGTRYVIDEGDLYHYTIKGQKTYLDDGGISDAIESCALLNKTATHYTLNGTNFSFSNGRISDSIQSCAVLNEAGTHYILNGSKNWVSNGGIADVFTVFAQVPVTHPKTGKTKDKITAFIVEKDFGGVSHGPPDKKMGVKCSNTAEVCFKDVPIPVENMLGEPGEGFKIAMNILNNGRFGMGACLTGTMKMLIAKATEHANQRKQFVSKLKEYPAIQEKISRMNMLCYANESMAYLLCGNMDAGAPEYQLEAAISKVFASQAAWDVCDETIQILGGAGFMKDVGVERWLRDLRSFRIVDGDNEFLKLFIALKGVQDIQDHLKGLKKGYNLFAVMSWFKEAKLKKILHSNLANSGKMLQDNITEFATASQRVIVQYKKHKINIVEEQTVLTHMADIAILLQSMAAVLSRSDSAAAKGNLSEIPIANAWCGDCNLKIQHHLEALSSDGSLDKQIRDVGISSLANGGYLGTSPIGI